MNKCGHPEKISSCPYNINNECKQPNCIYIMPNEEIVILTKKQYEELLGRPLKVMGKLTCAQIKKKFGVEVEK